MQRVFMVINFALIFVLFVGIGSFIGYHESRLQILESKISGLEQRVATKQSPMASAYCYVGGRQVGLLSDDPIRVYAPPSMAEAFAKATPAEPVRCVVVAFEKGTLTFGDDRIRLTPDHIYFPAFDGSQTPYLWWRADI